MEPPSSPTSASTVGLPRESIISRPRTVTIFVDIKPPEIGVPEFMRKTFYAFTNCKIQLRKCARIIDPTDFPSNALLRRFGGLRGRGDQRLRKGEYDNRR